MPARRSYSGCGIGGSDDGGDGCVVVVSTQVLENGCQVHCGRRMSLSHVAGMLT